MNNDTSHRLTHTRNDHSDDSLASTNMQRLVYMPPTVMSYTDEDILAELGPAQTVVSGEGKLF